MDGPPYVPKSVAQAFDRPGERKNEPVAPAEVISNDAADHDHEIAGVEPEKLSPGIFRPPVLANLLDKAAAEQRLVHHMDYIGGNHEPERKYQGNFHNGRPLTAIGGATAGLSWFVRSIARSWTRVGHPR